MTTLALRPARRRSRGRIGASALTVLTWIVALLFFLPVAWMFLTGFKQEVDASSATPKLFFEPTLDQFVKVFDRGIELYLLNSVLASGISLILVLLLAVPAGYALSIRPVRKWQDAMFFFLSTRFLPLAAAVVPIYLIARDTKMLDNIVTLIILYTAMNLPLAIWMIQSFMSEIPLEILEAASLDGAGFVTSMRRIILPLLMPGIAATLVICFIFTWNEFFLAVSLTSTKAATVPVFLVGFVSSEGLFAAQLSAAAALATLPVLLAGWFAQDKLIRGLTMGAVK
ncbi:carbohydrate ABC transporter permease [Microbacterium sp. 179-I 3D4 NHS]|uniref:carbohydrate ABC transporter permease n=1 Tax=Microbacterium sp. 179-I 3D4 NHS TaxID=3142381 RepID=UPI0039A28CE2